MIAEPLFIDIALIYALCPWSFLGSGAHCLFFDYVTIWAFDAEEEIKKRSQSNMGSVDLPTLAKTHFLGTQRRHL